MDAWGRWLLTLRVGRFQKADCNPLDEGSVTSLGDGEGRDRTVPHVYVGQIHSISSWSSHFYRKALLLYRLGRREEAIEADIRSIASYPWNWSAWTLLGNCVEDSEEVG